jgi:hypothetical protein
MPYLKTYDLFLSHMWRSGENTEYYRLINLLNSVPNFSWRNYSVPEHDPLGTKADAQLREALDRQIRPVNCFLVISGMYVNYRRWIQQEIEIAKRYRKPIVGVVPQGQLRIPLEVQSCSDKLVYWNGSSIVSAIREVSI